MRCSLHDAFIRDRLHRHALRRTTCLSLGCKSMGHAPTAPSTRPLDHAGLLCVCPPSAKPLPISGPYSLSLSHVHEERGGGQVALLSPPYSHSDQRYPTSRWLVGSVAQIKHIAEGGRAKAPMARQPSDPRPVNVHQCRTALWIDGWMV